ncbi:MAG: hypothetical protein AAB365_02095 [Patescibacteria group bacterium]
MTSPDSYKQIIIRLEASEPPRDLAMRISMRIQHARTIRNRVHIAVHGAVIIGSIVVFVPALQYAGAEASQSGFYEYVSLLASDGSLLISSWKELGISILESAPIMGATISVGALFLLTNSLRRGVRRIAPIRPALAFKN